MLDIKVTIEGDRIAIERVKELLGSRVPAGVQKGLERVAKGVHRKAYSFLSGVGAKASNAPAGGYPVPVRTGHLRRMLDWLAPGQSKSGEAGSFSADPDEVVIFDSASYATIIHEGRGSSAKFEPRRYLTDALERFNTGERIAKTIAKEIDREINKG